MGDDAAAVGINLDRLAAAANVARGRMISVTQVHGTAVAEAALATPDTEADALWTDVPGTAVAVRTADCLPILIEDPLGRVAAVHAGWRGVLGDIVGRTVQALIDRGGQASELGVGIGPCVQRCCFEVDGELPTRFEACFGAEVVSVGPSGKCHLDLPRAAAMSLKRMGVSSERICILPHCTMCDGRFFSHRRERGVTGRQFSFITCEGASSL